MNNHNKIYKKIKIYMILIYNNKIYNIINFNLNINNNKNINKINNHIKMKLKIKLNHFKIK
jgi:hypothetical protein